jgi:hypothetical protein
MFTEKELRLLDRALQKAAFRRRLYLFFTLSMAAVVAAFVVTSLIVPRPQTAILVHAVVFVLMPVAYAIGGIMAYRRAHRKIQNIRKDYQAQERVFEVSRIKGKSPGIVQQQTDPRYFVDLESGTIEVGGKLFYKLEKGTFVSVQLSRYARVLLAIEQYHPTTVNANSRPALPS